MILWLSARYFSTTCKSLEINVIVCFFLLHKESLILQNCDLEKPFRVHTTTPHRCRTPFSYYVVSFPAPHQTPHQVLLPGIPNLVSQMVWPRYQKPLLNMDHKDKTDLLYGTRNLYFHMCLKILLLWGFE